ncbi:MAG TPA: S8/S53 family peptidase [Rubrivivax sp.]|nr:S8/S53 family peptidase [Burkholderiales bacterium]HNT37565.1 S8/S53 family peptidase [Rubrivivax sp.]
MAQHLLELDGRGLKHTQDELARYLPGLDVGQVALSEDRALLPGTTLRALQISYGQRGSEAVLRRAGVRAHRPIDDADALDLLWQRDPDAMPMRAPPPASLRNWHLAAVKAQAAWSCWGGPEQIDWTGVKVGQIDTGYLPHAALGFPSSPWVDVDAGRTFFNPGMGSGQAGPGDGVDANVFRFDGHGTRVASVICGHDATATGGAYYGIAPRVPLVPVRIADDVFIAHAQPELAKGLRYLVNEAGVGVINLSMGFLPHWQIPVLDRAIDEAYEKGVILVCAAGQPLASVVSPAHGRRTIAAAGSTVDDIPWGASAHGSAVDWAAPADAIFRAEVRRDGSQSYAPDGDGTSYAAAITTGAAALWLARHRDALDAAYPKGWQRVEAFKAVARATAKAMPHQRPGAFGAGVLQIDALLAAPLPAAAALGKERPA